MTYNTNRRFTAEDIAALEVLQAEAKIIDADNRAVSIELDALLTAKGATFPGWFKYADEMGLSEVVEATDMDKYNFATANTDYIPQVGHYWNSKWNPTTWAARNKRTVKDIARLRKAIAICAARTKHVF